MTSELRSRRNAAPPSSTQSIHTITIRRTKLGDLRAIRFTNVNGIIVQFPLTFDQIVGTSGNVLRGDFLLEHGDVVWEIAANGGSDFVVAWPRTFEDRDPDLSPVFGGRTEAETAAKIGALVKGDRLLIVKQLMEDIEISEDALPEFEEQGSTSEYARNSAQEIQSKLESLKAMVQWAERTTTQQSGCCLARSGDRELSILSIAPE